MLLKLHSQIPAQINMHRSTSFTHGWGKADAILVLKNRPPGRGWKHPDGSVHDNLRLTS
jgi:hypothetical protein